MTEQGVEVAVLELSMSWQEELAAVVSKVIAVGKLAMMKPPAGI